MLIHSLATADASRVTTPIADRHRRLRTKPKNAQALRPPSPFVEPPLVIHPIWPYAVHFITNHVDSGIHIPHGVQDCFRGEASMVRINIVYRVP